MTNHPYDEQPVRPNDEQSVSDRRATAPDGNRQQQLSRLDELERQIAVERERLSRPDPEPGDVGRNQHLDSVREVQLPDLEAKVTESQREAWTLGYQAGLSDAQNGGQTSNPFHPLR
ncbi:hypothetical protein ACVBEQ_07120 [Nakamurella sp. GG22]